MIVFDKPIGAHGDCKELEYISALHQSGRTIRQDASITSEDVLLFLISRHGIKADLKYIEENLMPGLAGALDDHPEAVFDILEMTSILLIPHLRKAAAELEEGVELDHLDNLFSKVVKMITLDVTGDDSSVMMLDRKTMRKIMQTYGEDDVPESIIDEMMKAAGAQEDGTTVFDYNVLLHATTSDTQQYDLDWENKDSTFYDDVLDGTALDANLEDNDPDEELSKSKLDDAGDKVKRIFTAPTIDFIAENYRSKTFNIFLWVLVIVAFFSYAFQFQTAVGQRDCSEFSSEFGCRVVNSIISWLIIMAQLIILGTLYVLLCTAGNSIHLQHDLLGFSGVVIGILAITTSCILSYIFDVQFFLINTFKYPEMYFRYAYIMALIIGCFLLLFQLKAFFYVLIPRSIWKKLPFSSFWLTCEMAKAERCTKQAAAFKINRMVENAISHHDGTIHEKVKGESLKMKKSLKGSSFTHAMLSFQATADRCETVGGIFYTFRKMWDGTLFNQEGVWIHSRLYSMNLSQWFVVIFYVILYASLDGIIISIFNPGTLAPTFSPSPTTSPSPTMMPFPTMSPLTVASSYLPAFTYTLVSLPEDDFATVWQNFTEFNPTDSVILMSRMIYYSSPDLLEIVASVQEVSTLAIFAREFTQKFNFTNSTTRQLYDSGYQFRMLQDYNSTESSTDTESSYDFLPTESEVRVALGIGGAAAIIAAISLAVVWIPSSVSTILQFRCGSIPSLHDRAFQIYRKAPDLVSVLFGSAFWGTFFSTGSILFIVSLGAFFGVWSVTRSFVLAVIANVVGILVTFTFKIILLLFARRMLFGGFFRLRPMGGNVLMLVLECWSLGLTVGTMLIRLIKLILVSVFYIGRLDTPLFAPGIGMIGPVILDGHPTQFRKDLLLHDTHRHPYMERLCVIYLLKLRYGDAFATRAGGQWRLILVAALMPWLRRYRLDDGPKESNLDEKEENENAVVLEAEGEAATEEDEPCPLTKTSLKDEEASTLRTLVRKLNLELGAQEARGVLDTLLLG